MKQVAKNFFGSICIIYFPVILFVAALMPTNATFISIPYWFNLLALFLFTLPFYLAYIQFYVSVLRLLDESIRTKREKVMDIICNVTAFAIIIFSRALWANDKLSPISDYSILLLFCLWIIDAVLAKRKPKLPKQIRQPSFWIVSCISLLIAFVTVGTMVYLSEREHEGRYDDSVVRENHFRMWCDPEQMTLARGESGEIAVYIKNNSGKDYVYEGAESEYRPRAVLVFNGEGEEYKIEFDELPHTDDIGKHTVPANYVKKTTFYFTVPDDAPIGSYDIEMSFDSSAGTMYGVLTISS